MKFVVLFEDDPARADQRPLHAEAHYAFLAENADRIEIAGPGRDAESGEGVAIWLVEAENAAEVRALVEKDPFWPTGLRKSMRILAWTQSFEGGAKKG